MKKEKGRRWYSDWAITREKDDPGCLGRDGRRVNRGGPGGNDVEHERGSYYVQ